MSSLLAPRLHVLVVQGGVDKAAGNEAPLTGGDGIRNPNAVVALIAEPTPPELSTN